MIVAVDVISSVGLSEEVSTAFSIVVISGSRVVGNILDFEYEE